MDRWLQSRAYKKASALVGSVVASPLKLGKLVVDAQNKILNSRRFSEQGQNGGLVDSCSAALRLLKAYAAGTYRDISLESLGLIVASIIYFVMPIDALPDFILALGLSDDAALLAWTLKSVSDDLQRFMDWESAEGSLDNAEGSPDAEGSPEKSGLSR